MTTKLTKPTHAVVWLDRRDAQIIWFDPGHVDVQRIHSRSHHKSNGGHAGTHQLKHGREVHGNHSSGGGHDTHDEQYYHEVAQALGSAVEILVTGPAQAKDEFKAHCERHDPLVDACIVQVLPSDHPNDSELVLMARRFFKKYDPMHHTL
jgi:stalled ribosome rescue protein Dom34